MLKKTVLILLALTMIFSVSVFANNVPPYTPNKTYWVDKAYTGGGNDGTAAKPFTTISAAITAAAGVNLTTIGAYNAVAPHLPGSAGGSDARGFGHIIVVKPGAYGERLNISGDADLDGLWIMSYSTDPAAVTVTTDAIGNSTVNIAQNRVKITGITFTALTGQTAALVTAPATNVDFMFYNCVFDQNGVTTFTNGLVNMAATAAVTHTNPATNNTANFENCTFDLSDGSVTGIEFSGAFKVDGFEVKGCTFTGKDNLSSMAVKVADTAIMDNFYFTGNDLLYTKMQINLNAAAAASLDRFFIRGNNFELTDGVEVIAAISAGAVQKFASGLWIEGNSFLVNAVTLAARRASGFALHMNTDDQQIANDDLHFNNNAVIVKQVAGGDLATVRYTDNGGGGAANTFVVACVNNNWWGDAAGPLAAGAPEQRAWMDAGYAVAGLTVLTANAANVPTIDNSKGIEIIDVDHNGYIDKAVIYMTKRVNPYSVPDYSVSNKDGLNIGSGYVITRTAIDNQDGTAIAVYFTEKTTFDTSVLPQVTFTQANDANPKLGGMAGINIPVGAGAAPGAWGSYGTTELAATWTELAAAEVDKAAPVLIKAETQDAGYGAGTASNGFLDAIKFTFSEQVQGIRTAALRYGNPATDYETASVAANAEPDSNFVVYAGDISFNQGSRNLTPGTNVYTLAVGEVRLNTGLTPTVLYRLRDDNYIEGAANLDMISDFAVSATGAAAWNVMWTADLARDEEFPIYVLDAAPLVVASVQTADGTNDGKIDQIIVNFSEDVSTTWSDGSQVKFFENVPAFSSGLANDGFYTFSGFVINGAVVTFTLNPTTVATVYDTEAKPQFRYTPLAVNPPNTKMITDKAGVELAAYGSNIAGGKVIATTDGAAPVIVSVTTRDATTDTTRTGATNWSAAGANGRIDGIEILFSEKVMTDNGAQNGGTALDTALAQFALTHGLTGATLTKITSATATGVNKPSWTAIDVGGDTAAKMVIPFQEQSHAAVGMVNGGDTGAAVTPVYTLGAAADQIKDYSGVALNVVGGYGTAKDGAAPFIVQGIGRGWGANAFTNVSTVDSDSLIIGNSTDTANGNGYIDGFTLKFTEVVTFKDGSGAVLAGGAVQATALAQFTTAPGGGNGLSFASGNIPANTANTITLLGRPDYKGSPNTGVTPVLNYAKDDTKLRIEDAAANRMAAFTGKLSSDGAKPVIVQVNQNGDIKNQALIKFSEPVSGHYTATVIKANIDSLNIPSNQLFGYINTNNKDVTNFNSTYVKKVDDLQVIATLNGELTADDIKNDKVFLKDTGIFDDANATESALTDNEAIYIVAGTNITVKFYDDVVLPWIYSAQTVDADGNGEIDHIKFVMSETVKSSSLNGFVSENAMGNDVAATFILGGYTGTAKFNFFRNTDAGKTAAAAAGKPVFSDNAVNGTVLYLEIEEAGVPKFATTGVGSTGWTPTLTYGVAGAAPTLTDMSARANPLDKTPLAADTPAPFFKEGDTVADKVAPRLMKAEYANSKINLYFSEAIADYTAKYECYDFVLQDMNAFTVTYNPATTSATSSWSLVNSSTIDGYCRKLTGLAWRNNGIAELSVDPTIFPTNAKMGIQIKGSDVPSSGTNGVFKDGAPTTQTPAGPNTAVDYSESVTDVSTVGYAGEITQNAMWYTVNSNTFCPYPFDQVWQKDYLALVPIEGLKTLALTAPTAAVSKMTGQTLDVTWTSQNIANVDVYKSTDNGVTFTKIATVPAAEGKYTWAVEAGVDYLKIMSAAEGESNYAATSGLITVNVDEFAPIAGASNLTVTDVPNDNGRWFFARFKPSTNNTVNSYQFYRKDKPAGAADSVWVYFAVVPKTNPASDGFCYVMVPTPKNGVFKYNVAASTGTVISSFAAKEGEMAVAELVSEAAAKEAASVVSDFTDYALGGAEDNIAPSPVTGAVAADNDGAGTGIKVSWTNPADHGVVGYFKISDVQVPIYGADAYNVYRKAAGADNFVLAGTAGEGATSFIDMVADGTTVYEYIVKATDGTFEVPTTVPGLAMAGNGTADFNVDGNVSLGDLVLLGNMWGKKAADTGWIVNYDLNKDGSIGLGDLVILGSQWTSAKKSAKAAPMPGVALDLTAELNEATSMYYVTVGSKDALEGLAFTMKYDTNLYEFVKESVTGLGVASVANETKAGVIDIASVYGNEKFSGAITLGFKSLGKTGTMNLELANAEVALNGVIGSVNDQTVTLKALPTVYTLAQNFPNPFNPTTTIEYSIPTAGHTTLAIYNLAGQKIRTLVNDVQAPNFYKVVWDGKNDSGMTVATGTYFYKLVSGNYSKTVKMNLIK